MEDTPNLKGRLLKHFVLDLAIYLSCTLLNVKDVPLTTWLGAHQHVSSLVLESLQLGGVVIELQVPELGLLLTFGIGVEDLKEVLAFCHFAVSIGVHNLSKILHQSEVRSHAVSQTSNLAQTGDESYFIASLPILVDEQRLVGLCDVLVVPRLVVLFVADLSK
jgi:hypothetical protein